MIETKRILAWLALCLLLAASLPAEEKYLKAPAPIPEILDTPPAPLLALSPARDKMLLVQDTKFRTIGDFAGPVAKLAGYRINPLNNAPQRGPRYCGFTLVDVATGAEKVLATPRGARFGFPIWSPTGKWFAVIEYGATSVNLWVGDAAAAKLRQLRGVVLNAAIGETIQWMPDGESLLCQLVPAKRGPADAGYAVPAGPVIEETKPAAVPARTYQDLLANQRDEDRFDYYFTAQLARVSARNGATALIGQPGIFWMCDPSPDGAHVLVSRLHRPYSYLLPASFFPREVEVWDKSGKLEYKVASLPLEDDLLPGAVMPGPRRCHWRPTTPATLAWVEALDGGDGKKKAAFRDRVVMLPAPFTGAPVELIRTQHRFSSIHWGDVSNVVLVREYYSVKKWQRTFLVNPEDPKTPRLIWDMSVQDRYQDPGTPMTHTLTNSQRAMRVNGDYIYLNGAGASAAGDRPFLDQFNLATLKAERMFQSDAQSYDTVVAFMAPDGSQIIAKHESATEVPNYFLCSTTDGTRRALTHFADPAPQLRGVKRQLLTYQRGDGVGLSATLLLPPNYQPGQRLPTIVWAYPREYNDADTAGQVIGSPNRFTTLFASSHLYLLTQGYAILDGATMPVVGDTKKMNDTYLEQITDSARAAIEHATALGVTDPDRVGVGGHSYGAFMTANLLAHSDLFRAGVARSGAYNRTLTPFGFQSERRSLWEAQDMYLKVSPFLVANKIKSPLLLIHGLEDDNSGTFTLQSQRMFQAMRGTGGTARLVLLPGEAHHYDARESVEHVLAEMVAWFDKYVKNAPPKDKLAKAPASPAQPGVESGKVKVGPAAPTEPARTGNKTVRKAPAPADSQSK